MAHTHIRSARRQASSACQRNPYVGSYNAGRYEPDASGVPIGSPGRRSAANSAASLRASVGSAGGPRAIWSEESQADNFGEFNFRAGPAASYVSGVRRLVPKFEAGKR